MLKVFEDIDNNSIMSSSENHAFKKFLRNSEYGFDESKDIDLSSLYPDAWPVVNNFDFKEFYKQRIKQLKEKR